MFGLDLKLGLRIAAALALVALIGWGYHAIYQRGYRASEATWQARWTARDLAETKAKDAALAAQKASQDATDAHNQEIMNAINDAQRERDAARGDADLARRLLAAASRPPATSGAVPPAADQPGTAPAGGTGEGESLGSLVADAIGECRRNADRLDALIAEVLPQLGDHR